MASSGASPASPEASASSSHLKTCLSSTGSTSTRQNLCDELLVASALVGTLAILGHRPSSAASAFLLPRQVLVWLGQYSEARYRVLTGTRHGFPQDLTAFVRG
jgi:hypothetical protein